ncbi:hypothetical protein BC833DRAFT_618812 [Globomyces pollinis-pini]|nr:hypothetical protein BC833DRAFT_618812 [Globomyces pollinis-pini]
MSKILMNCFTSFLTALRNRWRRRRAEEEALRERCAFLERLCAETNAKVSALEMECALLQEQLTNMSSKEMELKEALHLELDISEVKNAELTLELLHSVTNLKEIPEDKSSASLEGAKEFNIQQPSATTLVENDEAADEWDFCGEDSSVATSIKKTGLECLSKSSNSSFEFVYGSLPENASGGNSKGFMDLALTSSSFNVMCAGFQEMRNFVAFSFNQQ